MIRVLTALVLLLSVGMAGTPALAFDSPPDYDIPQGHFYTEANGTSRGAAGGGFAVTDAAGIPFWAFFSQHGGVDLLGYPISTRFTWDGYVCQATQRAVLQWNPSTNQVQLANIFDYLSQAGRDDWLLSAHLAPRATVSPQEKAGPPPSSFLILAHLRFAWLYADPGIFHRYFNTPDYYAIYGLPTSPVQDLGPYLALRTQRSVFYHWKTAVPWADDRGVSVGLAGDMFKELGMIPSDALHPVPASGGAASQPLPATSSTKATLVSAPAADRTAPPGQAAPAPAPPAAPAPRPVVPVVSAPAPAPVVAAASSDLPVLTGVATWYGADFQGQLMANGVPYDMNNPGTCAANVYPLGTLLRVTRTTTGQSIVVRVTDHGAFTYPDITDLSYAAFAQLADPAMGMIGVRVEPVGSG